MSNVDFQIKGHTGTMIKAVKILRDKPSRLKLSKRVLGNWHKCQMESKHTYLMWFSSYYNICTTRTTSFLKTVCHALYTSTGIGPGVIGSVKSCIIPKKWWTYWTYETGKRSTRKSWNGLARKPYAFRRWASGTYFLQLLKIIMHALNIRDVDQGQMMVFIRDCSDVSATWPRTD